MPLRLEVLTGDALEAHLMDVARLRIEVFRAWPYLYDGDLSYEREYLQRYRDSEAAILVGAFADDLLVGAATGTPLVDHAEDFAEAFAQTGLELADIFYCAESVLLPQYRGRGAGHGFFDAREAHARRLGYGKAVFCSVQRPADHEARPAHYTPLDPFWRKRGYAPMTGVQARFAWKDLGKTAQTEKPLQFWGRDL